MNRPPPRSPLFPYPPLFRSRGAPPPLAPPPVDGGSNGTSYMVLLARSETRRRIRASAGLTYLTDIVAESQRSEEHTSELQSRPHLVCRLLLEKKKISQDR